MALFTTILGSALLASIANAAVNIIAVALLQKVITKKPKSQTNALDFEQTVQRRLRNGQPLEVLTGRRIVAGVGAYDNSYGTKNEYGVSITIMSAKPCTSFHTLFLDGEPVTISGDPTTGERSVTSHFTGKDDVPRVKIRVFLGDNNAALGSYLNDKFPSKFAATDDFGDYCVVILECRNTNDDLDEETGKNYIPFQGYPEYKVELSGVKVCDPRIVDADYEDEATYVYSDNAALIDAQYDFGWYSGVGDGRSLIVGNGYPVELMDLDQIEANADYCDDQDFTCAGIIRSGKNSDQEEIWKCYNADRVEYAASVYSVPEGNRVFAEHIDLSLYQAAYVSEYDQDGYSTEVYNEVKTSYSEPVEFFGEKDLPIYSKAEWIADDNHIPRQMSLPLFFVTDKAQAGQLEKQEIYISRAAATCTILNLPFGFIRLKVGNTVTISNSDIAGVNSRTWIVKGRGQTDRGDVSLVLRELADSEAFTWTIPEIPVPFITTPIARPWEDWWTPGDYVSPGVVIGILDGTQELADVSISGVGSIKTNNLAQDANIATALNAGVGTGLMASLNLTGVAVFVSDGGEGTTPAIIITAGGGTGPYDHTITKVSGDTITIDTPTSTDTNPHSTTFTGTPGENSRLEGVYKDTITDDNADTFEITFSVTINDFTVGTV